MAKPVNDNKLHEDLNVYNMAFSKGYQFASKGKSEEEVMNLAVTSDPQELLGLKDGWAHYHTTYNPSIQMSDSKKSLLDAVLQYYSSSTKENFLKVIDAVSGQGQKYEISKLITGKSERAIYEALGIPYK